MAGIYIHIPFCKSKCNYCDFFSKIPNNNSISKYIEAVIKELELRKQYLNNQKIETIYFGGGTPSILSIKNINDIFTSISEHYNLTDNFEFTFEANPDDLSKNYLQDLKNFTEINRLSIGVQSFSGNDLKLMERRHNSNQAINSIKNAKKIGFNNISADLIYGLPKMNIENWSKNLEIMFELGIQHLSAYHLTYEQGTVFYKWLQNQKINEINETESIEQFEKLIYEAEQNGFIHYEISNFAKPDYFSKHNFNYWKQKKYLSIGTSAHSFDGNSRQWNIANIAEYINSINENKIPAEIEILSEKDKFNEYIMTSLRTFLGIDIDFIENNFDNKFYLSIKNSLTKKIKAGFLKKDKNKIVLTLKGKFISDAIITDLFYL